MTWPACTSAWSCACLLYTSYIDAVESFGLPADTCPVPTSECGALVIDALPHLGSCYISSSMPCDGSVMASSYFARRFPDIPVHHLCFPVRYEDELTLDAAVEDVKECIRFIEKQTGEIAAGIEMAVAKRCFVMAKKAGATDSITLTGGCAKNAGLKRCV